MMERYEWRRKAKAVAIIDMVLSGMSLLAVIVVAVFAGAATAVVASNKITDPETGKSIEIPDEAKATVGVGLVVMWILVAIMALLTVLELWAAIKLLDGTEIGREPGEAHRSCATWRNVCIVFTVLGFIGNACIGSYIVMVICLLIRGIFLFVVFSYMGELETARGVPGSFGLNVKV
jgi:hypothetical protein